MKSCKQGTRTKQSEVSSFIFEELLDKTQYQVFIMSSPVPFPLNYGIHLWFVINFKGTIHRIEFGRFNGSPHKDGIGVLKDFLPLTKGMNMFFFKRNPRFTSRIEDFVEGHKNSDAFKLATFILEHHEDYPLKNEYKLLGPNSNSFVGWVLKQFPDIKMSVSFRAVGLNYFK